MTANQQYWAALLVSLVAAFLGWLAPTRSGMPIDYDAIIWQKKLERLRGFFRFSMQNGWISINPAS
jgi:integrase/recombinase XerD